MRRLLEPFFFCTAIVLAHWLLPVRELSSTGFAAVGDWFFALLLAFAFALLSLGFGSKALAVFAVRSLSTLERAVFSWALGLGGIAAIVALLGMAGLFIPWVLAVFLCLLTFWAWPAMSAALQSAGSSVRRFRLIAERRFLWPVLLIAALALVPALSPPYDYDGLMYHLTAPGYFLANQRITLLPDLWQANSPMLADMLFVIGLAFRSTIFSRLVSFLIAGILVLATYALARRVAGVKPARWAVLLLVSVPAFPFWAGWVGVDIAWALFQLLALYGLILWLDERSTGLLILAGLMGGFAMGTKLLAAGGVGLLALWVLLASRRGKWPGWRAVLFFGLAALAPALPWYLKNIALAGNPVYPFLFGGPQWGAQRLAMLGVYLQSFGVGRALFAYLLLPVNLLARSDAFNTFRLEFVSLGFYLAFGFPFVKGRTRNLRIIAFAALAWFILWSLGSQQTRFLLQIFPLLSILAAMTACALMQSVRFRVFSRALAQTAVGSMIVVTIFFLAIEVHSTWRVVAGVESAASFLARQPGSFGGINFVMENLPEESRVLMMWDGKGFYCDARCFPDAEQDRWTLLAASEDIALISSQLRSMGITHLLIDGDYEFILEHDPTGAHRRAFEFFRAEYRPACTRQLYIDKWTAVFELTCP